MASKRRRSRSAGAGGLGPFGFFLALGAIGVLIQYWWVLLIVLGVVGLTVVIVRFARTQSPPVMARSPKSARPLEPPPVMTPRSPALVSEDLAVQMRATKQVRHIRDMQEWDYEWIRLTHPEKSSRELSEIANAHFARGRSIGVNYEWARLLDSGSDQPAEGVGMRPEHHQSVKGESSNEHVLSDLDDGVPRVGFKEGQHHPIPGAGDGAAVPKRIPSGQDATEPSDPGALLAGDPRTMWAWAEHLEGSLILPISNEDARQILAAIPPGDHVEVFGAVAVYERWTPNRKDALPPEARFVARTFDSWILPSSGHQAETIHASNTTPASWTSGLQKSPWCEFTLADGRSMYAYADRPVFGRFREGAGELILRLPDNPLAPAPPELGTGRSKPSFASAAPGRLLGDWHTAKEVALSHMSGPLEFLGSGITGVSDGGVDVEHPEAVAQVKMQANPVGSPQIRQLRGAKPHLGNHVFYSTSGYTKAAIAEAKETGVALFTINDDATVHPLGAHAKRLILDRHQRHGSDDALVAAYINSVSERVRKAEANYRSIDARLALSDAYKDRHRLERAEGYLRGGVSAVNYHPRIEAATKKAIVSHFRNADLRAAFFCQVLSLPYPGDEPLSRRKKSFTTDDFY